LRSDRTRHHRRRRARNCLRRSRFGAPLLGFDRHTAALSFWRPDDPDHPARSRLGGLGRQFSATGRLARSLVRSGLEHFGAAFAGQHRRPGPAYADRLYGPADGNGARRLLRHDPGYAGAHAGRRSIRPPNAGAGRAGNIVRSKLMGTFGERESSMLTLGGLRRRHEAVARRDLV
jgi:hypothetical protein